MSPLVPGELHLQSRLAAHDAMLTTLDAKLDEALRAGHDLPDAAELDRLSEQLITAFAREIAAARSALREVAAAPEHAAWDMLNDAVPRIASITEELVMFIEGSLARAAGLDGGMCALADRLLEEVSKRTLSWERTTIPAAREIINDRTWIIGLPPNDTTIWSLPVMAHELGHFAIDHLVDRNRQRPGTSLKDGTWIGDYADADAARQLFAGQRAEELFADVFGAYVLGPAYAAALAWRAFPHRAWENLPSHPGWGLRVHAALTVLDGHSSWRELVALVRRPWEATLAAAGGPPVAPDGVLKHVEHFVAYAVGVLERNFPRGRFDDLAGVLDAERRLVRRSAPYEGLDLRMVLNAAWTRRLRQGWDEAPAQIGETAMAWCRELAGLAARAEALRR